MGKSIFNPSHQQKDVPAKIVAGLERISEAFKVLLWEKAKALGLSPIQIQLLIFVAYHKNELCNVSHLAQEFNVTKPTISDAVRILAQKKLIVKNFSTSDSRGYTIGLSAAGERAVSETEGFANPLKTQLGTLAQKDLENLFTSLGHLIYQLYQGGILSVQRTCYGCRFYSHTKKKDYCNLLHMELKKNDIRLDCPEFESIDG
ncbi:MAG: MarR family transcriptional regulator [Cyclobacteriaceae bacterium]|nr:MarR family transcriptional regulator [Cyclobacteriaceae bacterium]MCB0499021.1 MarR family transcriptional regulator [Cyclobacteriaceae bacterium]MCB9238297.1 MarR family transcriptional regulator [Flammeovirgaceae bacterium]MCO5271978.1 MarR family transcriptional regulator [Cyclobacteriaceae bacterium]MCW5902985.1 MarR family transcriptional regulator [Cyclobacteriaceae bacterium]